MGRKGAKPEDTRVTHEKVQQLSNESRIPVGMLVERGSIEAMEAAGQKQLVASESIPVRVNGDKAATDALLTKWGFELGSRHKDDELFRWTKLPAGWQRKEADHPMWSTIVDEHGKERVSIFYKAAFYDREAFMSLVSRYQCFYSSDASKYDDADVTAGYDIIRLKTSTERVKEGRAAVYRATDQKAGKVLAVFIGDDFGEVSDKAYAFMKERFGENYSDPARWDDP